MALSLPIIAALSQISDGLAYKLAFGHGSELNPLAAAIGDPTALLALKLGGAALLGAGSWVLMRRDRRQIVAALALVGYIGCLTELGAVLWMS